MLDPASSQADVDSEPDVGSEFSEVLEAARAEAARIACAYAGGVTPAQAWALFAGGRAKLVDVRSAEERSFVGRVPDSAHVAWAQGTALTRNPRFVRELESKFDKRDVLLLLCRSGNRSALAAEAAAKAGFQNVFNVLEGFEGGLDEHAQRGRVNGWRFHGLPWVQD